MKILFVGATGSIGGGVLKECLEHPDVSSIVAFSRRELPPDISSHPKFEAVFMDGFSKWTEEVLQPHTDAAAMIWTMGSYGFNANVDLVYPLAFQETFVEMLDAKPDKPRFRYVHLSGKLSTQDQGQPLLCKEGVRKIKGLHETKALKLAEDHAKTWQTFILCPGLVLTPATKAKDLTGAMMGDDWSIRLEELAAFMAYLAVDGGGEVAISDNARMVNRGRQLLAMRSPNGAQAKGPGIGHGWDQLHALTDSCQLFDHSKPAKLD